MEDKLFFEQSASSELVMTPSEFKTNYLFGTSLETQDGLQSMLNETIIQKLIASQKYVENTLDLKLKKQIVYETRDFQSNEFTTWGYIKTALPVNKVFELEGWFNKIKQITYPLSWITYKETTNDEYARQLFIVPALNLGYPIFTNYSGLYGNWTLWRHSNIPQYWHITYCTGFNKVPEDIKNYIGKLAAIEVLSIMGDIVLGTGIAAKSIHFDGLTQRISTTQGNGNSVFSARINIYRKDIIELKELLVRHYKGINIHSM